MRTVTIEQEVELPGTPRQVYEAYVDTIKHAEFTCFAAEIDRYEGGNMMAGGGYIHGKIIELVPDLRIVQTWHASDFPEGHDSELEIMLEEVENGTLLRLTQRGVPEEMRDDIDTGWKRNYWEPLRAYLGQH